MTVTTRARCLIPTIVLPLLIPSCKEPAAPAAPTPATAPADPRAVRDQQLLDTARRNVGEFRFGVYRYLDRRLCTGVIFSVAPAKQPGLEHGVGVVLIPLTEQEAGRMIDKLAQERLLRRPYGCEMVIHPKPPYYVFAGSAGRDCLFSVVDRSGPAIEQRLESYAAILDWPARDAIRSLFTTVGQPQATQPAR